MVADSVIVDEVDVLASKNLGLSSRSAFLVLLLVPRAVPSDATV